MNFGTVTPAEFELQLAQIVGLQTWPPTVGFGSFLTIDLGSPRVTSVGLTQGAFSLWIYGATWAVRERSRVLATSQGERQSMIDGTRALGGLAVKAVNFDFASMTMLFRFDSPVELTISGLGDPEMEEWFLYLDDGNVLTAGPGHSLVLESASGVK